MDVIGQLLLVAAYSAAGIRMAAAAEGGALPVSAGVGGNGTVIA
jgi:hypothetical protein